MDNQYVQDGKKHSGCHSNEDLNHNEVSLERIEVYYVQVLRWLPATIIHIFIHIKGLWVVGGVVHGGARAVHEYLVLEADWKVETEAKDEGETNAEPCILESVDSSKQKWLVDPDEPVDSHADNDVGRGRHEGVD